MLNSATLLQVLLAAFCAILCALSGMGGGGMMIGARTAAWAKSGYTAKDYVQDGLIAMWDGIENAGWGVHDPDIVKWKDLIGGIGDLYRENDTTILNNRVHISNAGVIRSPNYSIGSRPLTIELVATRTGGVGELAAMFVSPWLGINIRNEHSVRFTCKGDYDFENESSALKSYTLTRALNYKGFFINGSNVLEVNESISSISTKQLVIGNWLANVVYQVTGDVYCCRFYDRAISPFEIAANCAVDKARFNLT